MIGSVLQDKYKVERKIGKGGFATVYLGMHTQLKRPVAIKFLEDGGEDTGVRARFLREAESMARLNHPNIVAVYDFAEHKGRPYLVMEYINGPTLIDLVAKTTLKLQQVCAIALQVCRAMSYAHKEGIVHRDLTLRNVMINEGENDLQEAKILDFGLAKVIHDQAQTTGRSMLGTPYYMAPEQIKNESIDGRVDIFAFGVGLHRMVNGRFPFVSEHPAALMYLILNEFDIDFADSVPDAMKDIILSCLEKDARSRVHTFDELMPDLEAIANDKEVSGDDVSGTVTGLDTFAQRSSKRNPYLNRVMIRQPVDFVGRAREVRKIYSRLDAPHPQSISIVGERRIGKSSLLNYIYHPRNRKQNMQNQDNSIFAYLDFQQDADYDVPKFIDFLFNMFSYEGKTEDYSSRDKTLDQLREVVQELSEKGKRIIVLMDEFEVITNNKKFEESFFSFLRSLANSYKVAYVTSSHEDLQKMCHNQDISDSPFFNIFSNMPLRPFTRDEAIELIVRPSKTEGIPLEPYAEQILSLAGRFPMFLQMACSTVFEYLVENPDSELNWEQATRTFTSEVDPHYQFMWDHLDVQARENVTRMAAGKTINKKFAFVNEDLERRGFLLESGGSLALCSESFKSFVSQRPGRGRGKRGFLGSLLGRGD